MFRPSGEAKRPLRETLYEFLSAVSRNPSLAKTQDKVRGHDLRQKTGENKIFLTEKSRGFYFCGKYSSGVATMATAQTGRLRLTAEVFKAMGHPLRLGVIEFLQGGERCVCDIVAHMGTGISNMSKHLSVPRKRV